MSYIVVVAFRVDHKEFVDVDDTGPAVRALAQAMFKGDADFPAAMQMAVATNQSELSDDDLIAPVIKFAERLGQ